MCGIAGIVDFKGSMGPEVYNRVSRMLDVMPWRGPDGRGVWSSQSVAFGHVRLSIIDLSIDASQPMHDVNDRTIVFNGEIYNYLELKGELKNDYNFKSHSDTEVILAAYDKWGVDCVSHFNGDWAFIINDPKEKRVFVSRDRFGIKPLYYYLNDKEVVIASEVRAVIEGTNCRKVPKAHLIEFLKYRRHENPQHTLVDKIKPVPPGKSLLITCDGQLKEISFYSQDDLFSAEVQGSFESAIEGLGELFQDAVKLRLRADVPVGTLLSGGLDSSVITAVARINKPAGLNTYSAVFPGDEADESAYSSQVAEKYQTNHHTVEPLLYDFFELYDDVIMSQDSPYPSPKAIARYMVLEGGFKGC